MITCHLPCEPSYFNVKVREPGNAWIKNNSGNSDFPDYWKACVDDLRSAFKDRCAYAAMYIAEGSVDHFLSKSAHIDLTYEWKNYRYTTTNMNSRKKPVHDGKLLDPLIMKNGWFRILLPSLQLVILEDRVPDEDTLRKARETVRLFKLRDHRRIIERRRKFFEMYEDGRLSLFGLHDMAPLVADAVARRELGKIERALALSAGNNELVKSLAERKEPFIKCLVGPPVV